ncbi:MAG TPA: hypothetical protein VF382_04315 [Actinomycetota bacterium]
MNLGIFRALADRLRPLGAPFCTSTVRVRIRTWSGDRPGLGTATSSDLVLPSYLAVRQISGKEIASSGGRLRAGAVRIGPITPSYTAFGRSGGLTVAELRPTVTADQEVAYILTGEVAGEFALADLDTSDPLSWYATLNRTLNTP